MLHRTRADWNFLCILLKFCCAQTFIKQHFSISSFSSDERFFCWALSSGVYLENLWEFKWLRVWVERSFQFLWRLFKAERVEGNFLIFRELKIRKIFQLPVMEIFEKRKTLISMTHEDFPSSNPLAEKFFWNGKRGKNWTKKSVLLSSLKFRILNSRVLIHWRARRMNEERLSFMLHYSQLFAGINLICIVHERSFQKRKSIVKKGKSFSHRRRD